MSVPNRSLLFSLICLISFFAAAEAPKGFRIVPGTNESIVISEKLERIAEIEEVHQLYFHDATIVMFIRSLQPEQRGLVSQFIETMTSKYSPQEDSNFNKTNEVFLTEHELIEDESFVLSLLRLKLDEQKRKILFDELNTLLTEIASALKSNK